MPYPCPKEESKIQNDNKKASEDLIHTINITLSINSILFYFDIYIERSIFIEMAWRKKKSNRRLNIWESHKGENQVIFIRISCPFGNMKKS